MLMTLVFAFGMMAVQILGPSLLEYSTIGRAILALVLVLLGQFDLEEIIQASPLLGFTFFFLYILAMFLILMNIFLAILGEAYGVCREIADAEKTSTAVKTKKRSLKAWIKLVCQTIKL